MRVKQILTIILGYLTVLPLKAQQPSWKSLPDMPRARFGHCAVIYQDRVWLIGGKNQLGSSISQIDCYNLKTGRWEAETSELVHGRYNAAAAVYQNRIFVIGGQNDRQILSSVEYYDPDENKWQEWTPITFPREGANAVVFDNVLYVIGGIRSKGLFPTPTDVIEYWDESSASWQESTTWRLQRARVLMQTVVVDSFIYVLGGRFIDGQYSFVERLGAAAGPEARSPFTIPRFYFAAVSIAKLIYVLGGVRWGDFEAVADTIEYYATNSDTWYTLSIAMREPRAGLSAVSYDNHIYVFGGMDLSLKVSSTAEVLSDIPIKEDSAATAIARDESLNVPSAPQLLKNYPNPFNSATTIALELAREEGTQRLVIYNLLGKTIRTFSLNGLSAGVHYLEWDGRDDQGQPVKSGIYLAQLCSDRQSGKILKLSFIK